MSTCLSLPRVSGKPKSIHPSDTQAAYCLHTLTISHTGDKLKFGRQSHRSLVALWKHSSSFGGIYSQVLVASSFGGIYGQVLVALYGQVWWHLRSFGGFLRTSLVVSVCVWYQFNYRHKNHPKKYQWWSCHASLVVNGQKSGY